MYARCFSGSGSRTDAGSHVKILLTGTKNFHKIPKYAIFVALLYLKTYKTL